MPGLCFPITKIMSADKKTNLGAKNLLITTNVSIQNLEGTKGKEKMLHNQTLNHLCIL